MKSINLLIFTSIILLFISCEKENTNTNIVEFESNGYLAKSSINQVGLEYLKSKAISAYEYALPIVAIEQWHKGYLNETKNYGDWIIYNNRESKMPILTSNDVTPYVITYLNLKEDNYYLEIPPGPIGGMVIDIYQTPLADLGVVGPDKGKGGKYLLVGPDNSTPENHDADFVVKCNGNLLFVGTRIIGLKGDEYEKVLNAHKVYKQNEKKTKQEFIYASKNPKWMGNQTHGMQFWKDLNNVLQNEPVVDRNRFILTQLRDLGMVKGNEFNPSEEQVKILTEASNMGNAIAMVNTFSRAETNPKERHWEDRDWLYILNMKNLSQIAPQYYEIKEIASYSYEAITTSKGMLLNNVGSGSKYLGAYMDESGNWLDGKNTYVVNVPKDAPANQFWAITVYDNDTRCMIKNETMISDINSNQELKVEEDGSTNIYIGPKSPEGYEKNWIQSNPEKGFFVYLRLYGPLEGYYDKSWKMDNIKMVK
jgi:hypothetical protein